MGSNTPADYIHKVQHLIEECLVFNMSKEECMDALSKHANINPVITSTVWNELEKENQEFFESYKRKQAEESMATTSSSPSSSSAQGNRLVDPNPTNTKTKQHN